MATPILVTKLFIPSIQTKLVHRPDLMKQLNDSLNRKLALISAPAGFGKTTFISAWVDSLQTDVSDENQNKVAWLSFDSSYTDLTQLALRFALEASNADCAILGTRSIKTKEKNMATLELPDLKRRTGEELIRRFATQTEKANFS